MQLQAYKGYFKNKQPFYSAGKVINIPAQFEVTVILEERPSQNIIPLDKNRIDKRLAIVRSLKGIIPPDVDLEAVKAERIAKRGLLD